MSQDLVVWVVAAAAAVYLAARLTGFPRKQAAQPVIVGARLARALKRADAAR